VRRPRRFPAALGAGLVVVLLAAGGTAVRSARADPRITEKQAEARRALADIQQLDRRLGLAIEAYDGATYRLGQIRDELSVNRFDTRVVRANLKVAQRHLGQRLRDLYMSDGADSTIAVLLSAVSLGDLIDRLDIANTSSSEDSHILDQVRTFRAELAVRARQLHVARQAQVRLVAERAAEKAQIEQGLGERRRLLSSIRGEIARLQREDAIRQAELIAQARARLTQEQMQAQTQTLSSLLAGPTATVPSSQIGRRVVEIALRYLGLPYVWAAAGPDAFDCSGLVMYVFAQVGISLPHFAAAQWNYGVYVPRDQLQPGDLVFFDNLGHVGIYVGNGDFEQAPQPGDVVRITPLSDPWASASYYGARRIIS
jgi:cell wall-associated NlpC family hydrolase